MLQFASQNVFRFVFWSFNWTQNIWQDAATQQWTVNIKYVRHAGHVRQRPSVKFNYMSSREPKMSDRAQKFLAITEQWTVKYIPFDTVFTTKAEINQGEPNLHSLIFLSITKFPFGWVAPSGNRARYKGVSAPSSIVLRPRNFVMSVATYPGQHWKEKKTVSFWIK